MEKRKDKIFFSIPPFPQFPHFSLLFSSVSLCLWQKRFMIRKLLLDICSLLIAHCFLLVFAFPAFSAASMWQTPGLIDAGTGDAFRTSIAFDPYGNAIAVFEQYTDGVYRIYANQFLNPPIPPLEKGGEGGFDKGGWQSPVIIDAGPRNAYIARVAFDRMGDAIAIFKQSDGNVYHIYANHFFRNKGWQKPVAIDSGTGDADGHQITFDADGNAVVVFEQKFKGVYRIFANYYKSSVSESVSESKDKNTDTDTYTDTNTGWQGAVAIDKGEGNGYFPYPAFDYQGNIYVIYYKENNPLTPFNKGELGLEVYVNKYDVGKKIWNDPIRLTNGDTVIKHEDWNKKRSDVNRGIRGIYNPLFLPEIKKRIYAGSYAYNVKRFETPSKIDSRFRDAYTPFLIVSKDGEIMAFFVRWDGEYQRGYVAVYKNSVSDSVSVRKNNPITHTHTDTFSNWSKPEIIDASGGDVEHIRGAVNSEGEMAVVWTQWVDGNLRIHARVKNSVSDSVSVRKNNPITHTNTDTFSNWGKAEIIDAGKKDAYGPAVIFNGDNEIIAIWCQWEVETVKTYRNDYIKERGWGKAVRVEMEDETCGGCGLRIAASPDRRLIAIFELKVSVKERTKIYAIEGR